MSEKRDWVVWRCGISMTLATLRTAEIVLREQPHERMPFLAGALAVASERIESMASEIEELHKSPRGVWVKFADDGNRVADFLHGPKDAIVPDEYVWCEESPF